MLIDVACPLLIYTIIGKQRDRGIIKTDLVAQYQTELVHFDQFAGVP